MSANDPSEPGKPETAPPPPPEPSLPPTDDDGEPKSMRRPGMKRAAAAPAPDGSAPEAPALEVSPLEVPATEAPATEAPATEATVTRTEEVVAQSSVSEHLEAPLDASPSESLAEGAPELETKKADTAPPPAGDPPPESLRPTPFDEPPPVSLRPPSVSNLKPSKASTGGGTSVSLFGAGFLEGCRVWIENVPLPTEWVDAFCIRFDAPAHPQGIAHIEVENPDGVRSRTLVALAFERGPVVLDVHPYEIQPEGGVEITIEGEDFADGCAVNLFGVHAPEVRRENDKLLRFTAPPVGAGPYEGPLTVTNPDGLSCRIDHSIIYRALAPCIDAIEPAHGWVSGGKAIEVRGADFHAAARVRFGDRPAEVRFKSTTLLEVVVPPSDAVGPVDLVVENPDGSVTTSAAGFAYEPVPAPPKIISLVPARGATAGGQVVRISGDNFTETTRIRIAEVTAITRFVSSKIVDVDVPARAFPGEVAVEAVDGGVTVRVEGAFTYFSLAAPKVTGLDPASGPQTGGTKVVIEGEGFPANATVRIGREAPKHVAVKGPQRIEIVTPPCRNAGFVDVEVSSPETGPGVMKNAFRFDAVPPPSITSVAPNRGSTNGGTELTVEGKSFVEGATVLVGKKPAKRVKRISGSILEVITPDGDDGDMVDITVKNPDGREAVQKRAFQYDARYRG